MSAFLFYGVKSDGCLDYGKGAYAVEGDILGLETVVVADKAYESRLIRLLDVFDDRECVASCDERQQVYLPPEDAVQRQFQFLIYNNVPALQERCHRLSSHIDCSIDGRDIRNPQIVFGADVAFIENRQQPGSGTHVKPVAPVAFHVAYAAVPVFVNAVKPHGDGIFHIEQEGKDLMAVEAPRFLPDKAIQLAVQLMEEGHVAVHVHGRMVKAFPSGFELVYRVHGCKVFEVINGNLCARCALLGVKKLRSYHSASLR